MICTIDRRASDAGAAMLEAGGTATDAAIAANAVLAVTSPYACGLGGDLFALVHTTKGPPVCLNASGRSGSGAAADELRAAGHDAIPRHGHPAAVTIPGCVDGWVALHDGFGRLPLAAVLAPALEFASDGFAAGIDLAARAVEVAEVPGNDDIPPELRHGETVRRPGTARALKDLIASGRDGFYGGEFGAGLRETCPQITAADLLANQADWVEPLRVQAWGHDIWTTPPIVRATSPWPLRHSYRGWNCLTIPTPTSGRISPSRRRGRPDGTVPRCSTRLPTAALSWPPNGWTPGEPGSTRIP